MGQIHHPGSKAVSILVLLDESLEVNHTTHPVIGSLVSILVLLDESLEVRENSRIFRLIAIKMLKIPA